MASCKSCGRDLDLGYTFCHYCGTPVAASSTAAQPSSSRSLTELADQAQLVQRQVRETTGRLMGTVNALLGDPVSIQRQVIYSLLAGFALVPGVALFGFGAWLRAWLAAASLFFIPVRYWTTGVIPLSGGLNRLLGSEMSLRRRSILAASLTFGTAAVNMALGFALLSPFTVSSGAESSVQWNPTFDGCFFAVLIVVSGFLASFYLMGFVASWQPVWGCEFSISQERMGSKAPRIAQQIRESMESKQIAGLELTRVEMKRLRQLTSGDSFGSTGEQISFVFGRARIIVFVQDFGTDLFLRWAALHDGTGRRLWLLIGFFINALDRLLLRWAGSGLVDLWQSVVDILAPGGRHHLVLRLSRGGVIARTLRLAEGISEYAWNEIYALNHSVRDSVVAVIQASVTDAEKAREVRSQLEAHLRMEAGAGWAGTASRR